MQGFGSPSFNAYYLMLRSTNPALQQAASMTQRQAGSCTVRNAALLLLAAAAAASAAPEGRPSATQYIASACTTYAMEYEPLVEQYLGQFQGGFSTSDLLQVPSMYNGSRLQAEFRGAALLLYVLDGQVFFDASLPRPGGKRLKNMEYFGIPVLQQLSQLAGVYCGNHLCPQVYIAQCCVLAGFRCAVQCCVPSLRWRGAQLLHMHKNLFCAACNACLHFWQCALLCTKS